MSEKIFVEEKKKSNTTFNEKNLPHIEGINLNEVLKKLNISIDGLKKLFKTFEMSYSSIIVQINNEIENKNFKNGRMLLHRLEGAATIIGAEGVQIAAIDLREALKANNDDLKFHINNLDQQLKIVLDSIRSIGIISLEN